MKARLTSAFVLLLVGCASIRVHDAIDQVVADIEARREVWLNGFNIPIDLPGSASAEEVVRAEMRGAPYVYLTSKVVEVSNGGGGKPVRCIAALVRIRSREAVVLMAYDGERAGWFRSLHWTDEVRRKPNQPPEPTALSVTPRADARVAPASTVAHL